MGRRIRPLVALGAVVTLGGLVVGGQVPVASADAEPPGVDFSQYEGETLTYVYFTDGAPDEEATRAAIAAFTDETGIEVEFQIVPFADLETTLQAQISGGDAPDVARVTNWRPYTDVLVDMTEYFGDAYVDEFLPGQVATGLGDDGEFFAVPSDLTMNGPFVNVDAFNEAGVEVPTEWTWDEMLETARAVQEANDMEFVFAMDKSGHRVSTVLNHFGTTLLDADGTALDADAAEAAIGVLADLMADDSMDSDFWLETGSRYAGANEMFLAQAVPVYLSGNWQVGQFDENAAFEWAAVPNPCAERCGGFPGGKYMVAFAESDMPDAAAGFVEFMNSTEIQRQLCEGAAWLPTRNDLIESGIDYPSRSEDMGVFIADTAITPDDTYLSLGHPAFNPAATALIEQMDLVVIGDKDVPDAVADLQASIDQAVEDVGA